DRSDHCVRMERLHLVLLVLVGQQVLAHPNTTQQHSKDCGGTYYSSSGVIRHPPSGGNYQNAEGCTWLINNTNPITITFVSFDVEERYDYLYFTEDLAAGVAGISNFTGYNIPKPFKTTATILYLHFQSDYSVSRPGFELHWDSARCWLGYRSYKKGSKIESRCMVLKCEDGSWIFTDIIKAECSRSCKLTGDPHIETYGPNTNNNEAGNKAYIFHGDNEYALTQPGLAPNPTFGVNGIFADCVLGGSSVSCVKGVTYNEPGIEITLTVKVFDFHSQVVVSVNNEVIQLGDEVRTFGDVFLFKNTPSDCITIVGSFGLSVKFCKNSPYNSLEIWAMSHLQAEPTLPQTAGELYGLCDQYTISGEELNYYTMRDGTQHTGDPTPFADTWLV
ncbi:unnamed protein product, partial [Meganyctiphanes norvegica]